LIRSPAVRSRWESSMLLPNRSALEMDVEPCAETTYNVSKSYKDISL